MVDYLHLLKNFCCTFCNFNIFFVFNQIMSTFTKRLHYSSHIQLHWLFGLFTFTLIVQDIGYKGVFLLCTVHLNLLTISNV